MLAMIRVEKDTDWMPWYEKKEEIVDQKLKNFLKLPIDDQKEHFGSDRKEVGRRWLCTRTRVIEKKKIYTEHRQRFTNSCGKEIWNFHESNLVQRCYFKILERKNCTVNIDVSYACRNGTYQILESGDMLLLQGILFL